MSQQDGTQSPTKQRRSRKTSSDNQQNGKQAPALQRPLTNDTEAWKAYWRAQGQPWRIEPEIDVERQKYLAERCSITPNIEQGIYPFKDIKLSRADVEWLLATHDNGLGPVDWSDVSQRERWGLDLRGAILCQVKLHNLPLARLRGGLTWDEWLSATDEQRECAGVKLTGAYLFRTHLEGARLRKAHLEGTYLSLVHLEEAYLEEAYLERSNLFRAHLEGANLIDANLDYAILYRAIFDTETRLENVDFGKTWFCTALLADVCWGGASLANLHWTQVKMLGDEYRARQKEPDEKYSFAEWQKNSSSRRLHKKWGGSKAKRVDDYMCAVRANRQLAVALQGQGLNEEAARFAYHAQVLRKNVLWYQMTQQRTPFRQRMQVLGSWLFSWFLFLLAGYGYKPLRSIIAYLVIIFGFMGLYLLNAHFIAPHLTWDEALVLSVSSFHGRGFFTQNVTLGDTYARLAAIEAVVGLFIEISFIATFTQRFLGK